ncbi:MAG: hypothetical protein OHK003_13570 [Anaerolineales bacterium]
MKKTSYVLLVLVLLLSLTVQTVLAQGTLELLEARNDAQGGVIFVFRFSGNFNKNDFKGGQVFFGNINFPLNCNITDPVEGILQCTTSRTVAGHNVQINLAGQVFWVFVHARNGGGGGSQYCYGVYDWLPEEEIIGPSESGLMDWVRFDTHCQDTPANVGDLLINYYNPDWDDYFDYIFLLESPECDGMNPLSENAYFYDCLSSE